VLVLDNEMKNKEHYTVWTIPMSNIKIVRHSPKIKMKTVTLVENSVTCRGEYHWSANCYRSFDYKYRSEKNKLNGIFRN
jgi:hypothetical protein